VGKLLPPESSAKSEGKTNQMSFHANTNVPVTKLRSGCFHKVMDANKTLKRKVFFILNLYCGLL
jgi:hypothetical protein